MKIDKQVKLINLFKSLENFTDLSSDKFSFFSIEDAYRFCEIISKNHYENFPVGSILIPKNLRKYFYSIYAFARYCDDIADEDLSLPIQQRIDILTFYQNFLKNYSTNKQSITHPIFIALIDTLETRNLPQEPLIRLLEAFKMDLNFSQPNSWDDLLNYCHHSANPIGEMILRLFGEWNQETSNRANNITTALQLINFWQDLSIDFQRGRNYIPEEVTEENLKQVFEFTEKILNLGSDLPSYINNRNLKYEVKIILKAAWIMLEKEKKIGAKIYMQRPKLNKFDYLKILTTIL